MAKKSIVINMNKKESDRPVAMLVQIASKYESKVLILQGNKTVNAKSIMGMMSFDFANGDSVEVQAEGADADMAVEELANYLQGA